MQLKTEAQRLVDELKGYRYDDAAKILRKAINMITSMVEDREPLSTRCKDCGNFTRMVCDVCEISGSVNGAYYNTFTGRFICPSCSDFGRRLERKLELKTCGDRTAPYCTCGDNEASDSDNESEKEE
jgi:hypothetical protein